MEIRMLVTAKGSPDGIEVRQYEAGKKYDIPAELGAVFLTQGWAEEDKELVPEVKSEAQSGPPAEAPLRTKKRRR